MPRARRRPEVRRRPWGDRTWTRSITTPPALATQWTDVEQFLTALLVDKRITGLAGHAGVWEITLDNSRVLRVVADEASREELAILGRAAR